MTQPKWYIGLDVHKESTTYAVRERRGPGTCRLCVSCRFLSLHPAPYVHAERVSAEENNMESNQQQATELSDKKIEQLSKQPIIESFVSRSQDGKWVIHKTVITDIKPVSYFEKVLGQ